MIAHARANTRLQKSFDNIVTEFVLDMLVDLLCGVMYDEQAKKLSMN